MTLDVDDAVEALRGAILPSLHRVLSLVGAYAEVVTRPSELAAIVDMGEEAFEDVLRSMGFVLNPFAAWERTPPACEDGSWAYRSSLFADDQVHVITRTTKAYRRPSNVITRTTKAYRRPSMRAAPITSYARTFVFAHKEPSWIRHPIWHYRANRVDIQGGVNEVRAMLREHGVPFATGGFA